MTPLSLVMLEKKDLPPHLAALEHLETAVTLQSLLLDMEDQGEAPGQQGG